MKGQKLFPLVVVVAGLLAYANSFTCPFILDYLQAITENPTIRHLWPIWQPLSPPHRGGITVEGRPIINLSFAINYALGGLQVWGYHALNLAVHVLAGLTLFGVVRRTLLQPPLRDRFGAAANELALATAVLWTVHPLQTESVTFLIQRAESIMGLFYLLTIYCFLRGVESEHSGPWFGLCVSACALGMASKEVMASAPVMVFLYDRTFVSGSLREAWRGRRLFYLALASTWVVLGYLAIVQLRNTLTIAVHTHINWWEYLATQPGVILYYLRLTVWPSPLCLDRGWPMARTWTSILPPALVIVILLGATAWALRRKPVWGFLGTWFFLILMPTSSFVPLQDVIYEHRMYLSLAAVLSLVVTGAYTLLGRRSLAVFAAVAIGFGFLTWRRNQDYASEITLRLDGVAKFPNDPVTHYNLGVTLAGLGRVPAAIQEFEQVLWLEPGHAQAHYNLGVALARLGRTQEAMEHWEQALQIAPDTAEAHNNLGILYRRRGEIAQAIEHYKRALHLKPDYAEAHNNLGLALWQANRVPEAIAHYEQALRLKPDYAEAHNNLGLALWQANQVPEAIAHCEQALQIKPDFAEAHNNLGLALWQANRMPDAMAHYEQALRLKPDFAEAHYNLGVALERTGRIEDAIRHYEQALRIKPDYAEAQNSLARLRAAP